MGTEIFVIDDGFALVATGHRVPRENGAHWAGVSRRLRRLRATVVDVPSLSARHLPAAYLGTPPDLRHPLPPRPDRRRSHLHVPSSGAGLRGPDAVEAATLLATRDRSAATVSYELEIGAAANGLSTSDRTSIESMIGCSDIVTMSECDLVSLRRGERHADAVRWVMAQGPAIIALTDDLGGYVGYFRGGSVAHSRRVPDVGNARGAGRALSVGLLYALDERGLLGAGAHEALRRIGHHEAHAVFNDANRYGASTSSTLGSIPRHEVELGA
jgi:fructokinase